MELDLDRVISQLQDGITNLKKHKGEGNKPVKKTISTNTSLKVPPTPGINLEDYALDNFCCTHYAYHYEKTCPEFLNSLYALLLAPRTPEKENKDVGEENYEDEERDNEELKEAQHPPNLILDRDETKLDNINVDVMKEDCMGIDYNLLSKKDHSTSNSTTIASTQTETSTKEFLEKDE